MLRFVAVPFTQYHILFHPCRQIPLKKGNSQMDTEQVFLYVYGAPEPIPRNEFRQPM
jgi:hypothetical protein